MGATSVTGTGYGSVPSFSTQNLNKTINNLPDHFQFTVDNDGETLSLSHNSTAYFFNTSGGDFTVSLPHPSTAAGKTAYLFNNTNDESTNHVTINGPFGYGSETESIYSGHCIHIISDGNVWLEISND